MKQGRLQRTATVLVTVAVALAAAGNGPAWSAETVPGARDTSVFACPPERVPDAAFVDTSGNTFRADIDCLAWYGITTGGPGGRPANQYGPGLAVSRDQMASFIVRSLDFVDPGLVPAYDGQNRFTDVGSTSAHVEAINRLADVGIVFGGAGGAPATTYSPGQPVQRDQMASFIARTIGFVLEASVCVNVRNYFDDDNGNTHETCINGLADVGIVVGTSPGRYTTAASVSRAQMSGFIMRMMDFLVEQRLAGPPA